jgi:hypothetical protein
MIAFIDDYREVYGFEPICGVLRIAPLAYSVHVARRADPARASPRVRQDLMLMEQIRRVHAATFRVYGARNVWRQLGREGVAVARCTLERLMGLRGAVRGNETGTTIDDRPRLAWRTRRTGSSGRRGRTCCGCRISPISQPGRASST